MANLLKVFVLLFKFGPSKIIQNIEESRKDLITGLYTLPFFLSLVRERINKDSSFSLVRLEVLYPKDEDQFFSVASFIKRKAKTDLLTYRGDGNFLLFLEKNYLDSFCLAREIAGKDMNFIVYPIEEINKDVLLKIEEMLYRKKILKIHKAA